MAKRRAEEILFDSPPSKKYHRGLCNVDMRLESMALSGDQRPPSLLTLLGNNRRRKRPFNFQTNEETDLGFALSRKYPQADLLIKHASNVTSAQLQTSENVQESRISANTTSTNSSKRAREDLGGLADTANTKAKIKVDADSRVTECSSYNSFQFWRIPLPELDMSLLQESSLNDISSDDMET